MQGERVLLIEGNSRLGSTFIANCEKRVIRPKIDYCAQGLQSLYWMVSAGFGVCPFWTSEFRRIFFYDLTQEPLQYLIRSHFAFHL